MTVQARSSADASYRNQNRVDSKAAGKAGREPQTINGSGNNGASTTSAEVLSNSSTTEERLAERRTTSESLAATAPPPPAAEEAPPATVPWDVSPVSTRVADLMATENLSKDAAVVIAMTERKTDPANPETAPTLDEDWQGDFAQMVSGSANEIATWAESQNVGAITFVPGDNDITVSQRADGMLVINSSLNGVNQSTQVVDPAISDRIVINAGSGNDSITVDNSVTANLLLAGGTGNDFIYGGGGNEIIIGGAGDDLVRAGAGTDIVLGGTGNDNLEGQDGGDIILGQQGDDYLSGDKGNDLVLGGDGQDSLYGGDDEDILLGQVGNDYLDAGRGNDLAKGGDGNDVVSGGKGDDEVRGDAGADTLIGASGADVYGSLDAADTIFVDTETARNGISARVPGADVKLVEIDQDAGKQSIYFAGGQREEFVTRVEDDLETLRSLESGQAMLNGLDQARADSYRPNKHFLGINLGGGRSGHRVQMRELDGAGELARLRDPANNPRTENGTAVPNRPWTTSDPINNPAGGSGAVISYNPSVNIELNSGAATPPAIILFHEMAHAYNMVTGTGLDGTSVNGGGTTSSFERQAVGLSVDHDQDPSTPQQRLSEAAHPFQLTENGLRTELNLALRPVY